MNNPNLKTALFIFLFFVCAYYALSSGHFYVADEASRFKLTQSLWDRHSIAIDDTVQMITGRDGRVYSKYPPAPSVLAVPLYAAGKMISRLAGSGGTATGVFFGSMFNQVVTALTCCMFFFTLLLLGHERRAAKIATLLFGLGTLALPYSRTFFGESLTGLSFLCAFYFLRRHRVGGKAGDAIASGCFLALAVASQYTAVFLTVPFAFYMTSNRSPKGRKPTVTYAVTNLILIGLPLAVMGLALMYYNFVRFGGPFSTGYFDETFSTPLLVGLRGFLLSAGKSIFLYCPLVIAVIPLFPAFNRRHPDEAKFAGACFLIYLLIHSRWNLWGGDLSWGPRYLVPVLPLIFLPLGMLVERGAGVRNWRRLAAAVFALGLLVNSMGMLVNFKDYYTILYSEERPYRGHNDLVNFAPRYSPVAGHSRLLLFIACRTVRGEKCGSKFFNPNDRADIKNLMTNELKLDFRISFLSEKSRSEKILLVSSYVFTLLLAGWCALALWREAPDGHSEQSLLRTTDEHG